LQGSRSFEIVTFRLVAVIVKVTNRKFRRKLKSVSISSFFIQGCSKFQVFYTRVRCTPHAFILTGY